MSNETNNETNNDIVDKSDKDSKKKLKLSKVSPELLKSLPQDKVLEAKIKSMDEYKLYQYFRLYSKLYQNPNQIDLTLTEKTMKSLKFTLILSMVYVLLIVVMFFIFSYFELSRGIILYPTALLPFVFGIIGYFLVKRSTLMDKKIKLEKINSHNKKVAEECYKDITFTSLVKKTVEMGSIRDRLSELNDLITHQNQSGDTFLKQESQRKKKKNS